MNAGKKLVRNTVFGLWGVTALFIGLNRLNATTPGTDNGGSFLALGLRQERGPEPNPEIDLAAAKDFSRLSVRGPLTVEIVGAGAYKVTLTPAPGQAPEIHAYLNDGVLHVDGGDSEGAVRGVLRVEAPSLQRIDAGSGQVMIHGLNAPELSLYMYNGGLLRLEQNQVQAWKLYSGNPLEARVDDATFAAGSLQAMGDVVIRRAP